MKKTFFISLFILLVFPIIINAKEINLYLFHSSSCPHCKNEIEFLEDYVSENENINLIKYEISSSENSTYFKDAQKLLKRTSNGVPYLIIGSSVIVGYDESYTKDNIISKIDYYEKNNYVDIWGNHLKGISSKTEAHNDNVLSLPILGKVNIKEVSLLLVAVVLGFVDGFNPCAMWILIFLITMLLTMENKKKRVLLGIIFLLTSGLVYLFFMFSWLSFASVLNSVKIIQILIGIVAVIFGGCNIFKSTKKDVGCEVANKKKRKNIIERIKNITVESRFIIAVIGIVFLAISVNFIELMCSLGLPVLFTQILSINKLLTSEYVIYMLIYIIFYLIDDIIIFIIAMKTFEIKAISNKYGKYSHLIGGIIMLIIGILMIVKPEWLMFNF